MGRFCAVPGCSKPANHRFPKDPDLCLKWRIAIKREGANKSLWKPGNHSYICGDHFREEDYQSYIDKSGRKHLEPDAVPSLFAFKPVLSKETSARSQRALKRWKDIANNSPADVVSEEVEVETSPELSLGTTPEIDFPTSTEPDSPAAPKLDFPLTPDPLTTNRAATVELDFLETSKATETSCATDKEMDVSIESELGSGSMSARESGVDMIVSPEAAGTTTTEQFSLSFEIIQEETGSMQVSTGVQTVICPAVFFLQIILFHLFFFYNFLGKHDRIRTSEASHWSDASGVIPEQCYCN